MNSRGLSTETKLGLGLLLFYVVAIVVSVVAWFHSVFYTFHTSQWLLLIADCIFPPIGALHGIYLWLS